MDVVDAAAAVGGDAVVVDAVGDGGSGGDDGLLEDSACCGHCVADVTGVASRPGDYDGAASVLGTPPSSSAGCGSRIGPFFIIP